MSQHPVVHKSKKEAIFQLCNFLCSTSILEITDLADGEILLKTIKANFGDISNDTVNLEDLLDCPDKSNLEIKDESQVEDFSDKLNCMQEDKSQVEDFSDKLNCTQKDKSEVEDYEYVEKTNETELKNTKESNVVDIEHKIPENESIIPITHVKLNESHPAKNDAILLRFNHIQKFIDDCYQIKSKEIISYYKCTKSCELELTKVAIFVLSEVVSYLFNINKGDLQTLFHLDMKYQVELQECFKLFISERDRISKDVVEELLSKSVRNVSPFVTPRRTSSRRKSIPLSTPSEDVFTNSPLKSFFESPIFKKEDILMKEKEITNLKKLLEFGEEETYSLHCKLLEEQKKSRSKDKKNKELQKQVDMLKEEMQSLQNICHSDLCKEEKEKLFTENEMSKSNVAYLTNQVVDLNKEIVNLHALLEEKDNMENLKKLDRRVSGNKNDLLMTASKKITAYEEEIGVLTENIKKLELKNHAYKQQLSDLILTDLKEKKSPGNLNQSYEERWAELDKKRKEEEENLGRLIEADNKILWTQLNEVNLKNKKLLEEIEILKKQPNKEEKLPDIKKKFCSVSTITTPELIPQEEKFRNSLNHSKSAEYYHLSGEPPFTLNDSDNPVAIEHSIVSPESEVISEVIPCPEKSSEAVLWKMYNSENSVTENTYDIKLDLNPVASENCHLDLINELGINNDKMGYAEADVSNDQENKYVLGNLNFNVFLNELKKLTKNGSFQKVLQVFGKRQKEINGTNKSNRLDLQEMLQMITECVCVAVALNAESSFANLQDKCCMTDENDFFSGSHNIELDQLKKKLSAISQEHEIELKECKKKLEKLNKYNVFLERKYQACGQKLADKVEAFENLRRKYLEINKNFEQTMKDNIGVNEVFRRAVNIVQILKCDRQQLIESCQYLNCKRHLSDKNVLKLKVENGDLNKQLQKFKEKISELNALKKKENKDPLLPSTDSSIEIPKHPDEKSEFQCSSSQDTANESVLSGAFRKNLSHYVSENEEDYFNYNSLDVFKKDNGSRVEELKRRNSLLPLHLQSTYPVESNLSTAYESLYVKDSEKNLDEKCCKKRKLDDAILEEPSCSTMSTPVMKPRRKLGTPKSLQRFMKNIRIRRTFPTKPRES